jgi:lipopolysaccharide transport system ATP-binding protein
MSLRISGRRIPFIDEVLAVRDPEFQKKCLGKMSEVAEGGRTVLFVGRNYQPSLRLPIRLCGQGPALRPESFATAAAKPATIER